MALHRPRIRDLQVWLSDARYFLLASGVVAIAIAVIGWFPSERVVRLSGLVLQVLGIATVLWGISETRALFGHPSVASKFKAWVGRHPFRRRDATAPIEGISVSASITGGRMYSVYSPKEGDSSEQRIEVLEKNVLAIHERIDHTESDIDRSKQQTEASVLQERRARQAEDQAIRRTLEATGTGGVHISAIGALWLFVGVTLSTAAPEISVLINAW